MIDTGATPAARVSAAIATLDRGYGKPAQSVHQHVARHIDDYSDAELIAIATGSDPAAVTDANGAEEVDSVHRGTRSGRLRDPSPGRYSGWHGRPLQ